jgi:hypothetical protein
VAARTASAGRASVEFAFGTSSRCAKQAACAWESGAEVTRFGRKPGRSPLAFPPGHLALGGLHRRRSLRICASLTTAAVSTRLQHPRLTESGAGERWSAWPAREMTTAGFVGFDDERDDDGVGCVDAGTDQMVTGRRGTGWLPRASRPLGSDASRNHGRPTWVDHPSSAARETSHRRSDGHGNSQ